MILKKDYDNMAIKSNRVYISPVFYLALIPIMTLTALYPWKFVVGLSPYIDHSTMAGQLELITGGMVFMGLLAIAVQLKVLAAKTEPVKKSAWGYLAGICLGLVMAGITYACSSSLMVFTGWFFWVIVLLFMMGIFASIRPHSFFYLSYALGIFFLLFVEFGRHGYQRTRLIEELFCTPTSQMCFVQIQQNLDAGSLFGAANTPWIEIPMDHGQFFFLKLIHSLGYIPAGMFAAIVMGAWIFAWIKLYRSKPGQRTFQRLFAMTMAMLLLVFAIWDLFINLGICCDQIVTGIMPLSTNGALWVLFMGFCVACISQLKSSA